MKECFLITSYCNSEEKLESLISTIDNIKKYNIDIFLHAHFPLPEYIQKKVNYYLFDKSNPVFSFEKDAKRGLLFWRKHIESRTVIKTIKNDYGYTVLQQYKRGCNFIDSLNKYDFVHIINYDTKFTEDFFSKNKEYLKGNDMVIYNFGEGRNYHINQLFFSANIKSLRSIVDSFSLNDYARMKYSWVSEDYFRSKINGYKGNIKEINFEDYGDFVDKEKTNKLWSDMDVDDNPFKSDYENFNVSGGEKIVIVNDNELNINLFELFIYDIKEELNIKFEIGDDTYHASRVRSNFYFIETSYSLIEFRKLLDENRVKLTINGILIKEEEMAIFRTGKIVHNSY